jgi:hypothetical protein
MKNSSTLIPNARAVMKWPASWATIMTNTPRAKSRIPTTI